MSEKPNTQSDLFKIGAKLRAAHNRLRAQAIRISELERDNRRLAKRFARLGVSDAN